jgi:hypothetical protein
MDLEKTLLPLEMCTKANLFEIRDQVSISSTFYARIFHMKVLFLLKRN